MLSSHIFVLTIFSLKLSSHIYLPVLSSHNILGLTFTQIFILLRFSYIFFPYFLFTIFPLLLSCHNILDLTFSHIFIPILSSHVFLPVLCTYIFLPLLSTHNISFITFFSRSPFYTYFLTIFSLLHSSHNIPSIPFYSQYFDIQIFTHL
jgi:hypothetical protein